MPKATIDDVAELAGVSIKTVSRVVNHEPNVRESTRARVDKAISKLKYRPNQSARNLASHRSYLIGLVYDDPARYEIPSSGYVINMQQGALAACKAANYDLLIHPCSFEDRRVGPELRALIEHARPDGIVLAAPLSNMPKIVKVIQETGTPLVRLSPGKNNPRNPAIVTNDRGISKEMTEYLAGLGHRRIAFISGHASHAAVANRLLGYQEGLQAVGIELDDSLVVSGDNSIASGEAAAKILLSLTSPPTAIFAANDDMAAGVIRVADRMGIRVPDQLSVAGFDDIPLARQIYPALTTIKQPLEEMAERAAESLIKRRVEDAYADGPITVPSTIQVRESTGPAPD